MDDSHHRILIELDLDVVEGWRGVQLGIDLAAGEYEILAKTGNWIDRAELQVSDVIAWCNTRAVRMATLDLPRFELAVTYLSLLWTYNETFDLITGYSGAGTCLAYNPTTLPFIDTHWTNTGCSDGKPQELNASSLFTMGSTGSLAFQR